MYLKVVVPANGGQFAEGLSCLISSGILYTYLNRGCQFGAKRAKLLDFGFILLCLATKNSVWLLSIFWLFLASFYQ